MTRVIVRKRTQASVSMGGTLVVPTTRATGKNLPFEDVTVAGSQ